MIRLTDCTKIYENGNIGILDVNLDLPNRGIIWISGLSGSGKSTLIHCLSGLDSFSNGKIEIDGKQVDSLFAYSAFSFQETQLFEDQTVSRNLSMTTGLKPNEFEELLRLLKIDSFRDQKVNRLSGGQRARVSIARVLLQKESILFFDEPFANLDQDNVRLLCSVFKKYSEKKLIFISSHLNVQWDHNEVIRLSVSEDHRVETPSESIQRESTAFSSCQKKHVFMGDGVRYVRSLIRKNRLKSLITCVFSFISFVMIAVSCSILSLQIDRFTYQTYVKNDQTEVTFRKSEYGNDISISNADIERVNPDIVNYRGFLFSLLNDETSCYFRWIKVSDQLGLADDEAIVATDEESNLTSLKYLTQDIRIVERREAEESTLYINRNLYQTLKANAYGNCEINVRSDLSEISTKFVYYIYNPYCSRSGDVDLIEGTGEVGKGEVVIPQSWIPYLNSEDDPIGKSVDLTFVSSTQYKGVDIHSETLTFIIKGISHQHFCFDEETTFRLLAEYGIASLETADKSMTFLHYTEKTFLTAYAHGLIAVDEIGFSASSVYWILKNLQPVLFGLGGVFIVICVLTLLNSITGSVGKTKKDIGILISFNVSKRDIALMYLLETAIPLFFSLLLSFPSYFALSTLLNRMFEKEWLISVSPVSFHPHILLGLLLISLLFLISAMLLILMKISGKSRIDIVKDR